MLFSFTRAPSNILSQDTLWAVAFSTSDSTVTLTCGSSSQTFEVGPGVQKLKIPLSPGKITITMVRNGVTVIDHTPSDYTFVTNPKTCESCCPSHVTVFAHFSVDNYNAYVGAASRALCEFTKQLRFTESLHF